MRKAEKSTKSSHGKAENDFKKQSSENNKNQ